MRAVLGIIVLVSILGGCATPPITPTSSAHYDVVLSTPAPSPPSAHTSVPAFKIVPTTPLPVPAHHLWSASQWQTPRGLTYTFDQQVFTVNLTDGSSTSFGAAPPEGSIQSRDGTWYWRTSEGIMASSANGTTSELILSWTAFTAQVPEYTDDFAKTLTMRDDQRTLLFDASYRSPGGFVCGVFVLTIVTRTVTSLDLACGMDHPPRIAPHGRHAVANRRYMPDGEWLVSTFLFTQHRHDGGHLLNLGALLDVVWLADNRFIYSVDQGRLRHGGEPPAANVAAGQRIVLADQDGNTLRILVRDVLAMHLATAPDAHQLAYVVGNDIPDTPQELWIVPLDGGAPRKLATLPGTVTDLVWYP